MTDPRMRRGLDCETLAAAYLQDRGVAVLARNARCRAGELDIIARQDDLLIIVEVRQRGRSDFGGALVSVNRSKQRKIIRATRYFLQRHWEWRALALRFDVVAIEGAPDGTHEINWVQDAFRAR
jgi:putative endonuclease